MRRHVLFVDEHQIIRALRPLQGQSRLRQGQFRLALGVEDAQIDAQIPGGSLHELRVADPECFLRRARIQEQHRLRTRAGTENRAEQQQAEVKKLEHESSGPKEKWPRIIAIDHLTFGA